ncbi:hypothetical protein GCM10009765_37450 [Fodinicola feengrottensis]|uniref:Transposase IS4-like domain-containing protein n=1 Tax=Fodinicola feengrottensis TaxID=435914 RepID=A0ABN2HB07_9ACTN
MTADRPNQTLIGDKNYFGTEFRHPAQPSRAAPAMSRAQRRTRTSRFSPLRQTVESINQTLKGQLDLERHRGHTPNGVIVRVLQRILALTTAIWHNDKAAQPIKRSLIAYDH